MAPPILETLLKLPDGHPPRDVKFDGFKKERNIWKHALASEAIANRRIRDLNMNRINSKLQE